MSWIKSSVNLFHCALPLLVFLLNFILRIFVFLYWIITFSKCLRWEQTACICLPIKVIFLWLYSLQGLVHFSSIQNKVTSILSLDFFSWSIHLPIPYLILGYHFLVYVVALHFFVNGLDILHNNLLRIFFLLATNRVRSIW